jgi:hypothetical protein
MSQLAAVRFLPATFGLLREHAPSVFYFFFPNWVLEQCPLPSTHLKLLPGENTIPVDWPVSAATMIWGIFLGCSTGLDLLLRSIKRNNKNSKNNKSQPQTPPQAQNTTTLSTRQAGLFVWGLALLWYALMCLGGLFFHCLRGELVFHLIDVVATSCSAISIIAGFAAMLGHFDDTKAFQRLGLLLTYLAISATALLGPSLLQEQLYLLPIFGSALIGIFITKSFLQAAGSRMSPGVVLPRPQSKLGFRRASLWLVLTAVSFILGLGSVTGDAWLCVNIGVHFSLLFTIFFSSNLSMWCLYRFVLVVYNENLNLDFNHSKRQS